MTNIQELPRIKGFCKDCRYAEKVPSNDIHDDALHCMELRGEEANNVRIKYKKTYRDLSLVFPKDYCSSFAERQAKP